MLGFNARYFVFSSGSNILLMLNTIYIYVLVCDLFLKYALIIMLTCTLIIIPYV